MANPRATAGTRGDDVLILIGLREWRRRVPDRNDGPSASVVRPAPRGPTEPGPAQPPADEWFSTDDAVLTALLIHLLPITLRTPPERWPAEALKASRDLHQYFVRELTPFTSRIPRRLPELRGRDSRELGIELFGAYLLEKMEVLACAMGRYDPVNLRVEGESHLREALDKGNGAVLWCENSFSSSLLQKAAIAAAGYRVHHLSRHGHNLSSTRLGMRFLNPIVRKAENRYLAEVFLVDGHNQMAVSRHILELLRANQVVSVTVINAGSQTVEAPLLDGVLSVATGAPHFAARGRAPLLPVLSYRDGNDFVAEIGAPIELQAMNREAAYEFAVQELARRIDAFVRLHPIDWCGWLRGSYIEAPAAAARVQGERARP